MHFSQIRNRWLLHILLSWLN